MFKLAKFYLLAAVILMSGCATAGMLGSENPFVKFYIDQTGGRNLTDQKDLEIPSGDPQLMQGTNVYEDDKRMAENNYRRLGYSLFSDASINQAYAVIFGRDVHAAAVVLYAPYTSDMYPENDPEVFAEFQQKANEWRALVQKPKLPEEARRFRVLADDAVQNKEFAKAAGYYDKGLVIEPMWPAAQYNAARIDEELKNYNRAALHMKKYLALKPDALDAKECQDKVYIWEERAREASNSASANRYDYLATYWIKGKPPLLGVLIRELNLIEKNKINSDQGVVVVSVVNDTPASLANLFKNDIIKKINDTEIIGMVSFLELLKANAGKKVALSIIRDGQEIVKIVQLNAASS